MKRLIVGLLLVLALLAGGCGSDGPHVGKINLNQWVVVDYDGWNPGAAVPLTCATEGRQVAKVEKAYLWPDEAKKGKTDVLVVTCK